MAMVLYQKRGRQGPYGDGRGAITVRNPLYRRSMQVAVKRFAKNTIPRALKGRARISGFFGRFPPKGREYKFFDTANGFSFDSTGEVPATGQLVLIPQGTTQSQRIGQQCTIKSIQIKGNMTFQPGADTDGSNTAYMWLVLDKQCNGAAATMTDVFTSTTPNLALINLANSDRFVILKKWVWNFTSQSGIRTAFGVVRKPLDFYKKVNIPLEYSSTTGAITEIRSNNIFFLAAAYGADDLVTIDGITRVRYEDS